MISEEFVIIPLEVQSIVPYGIGSVKIRPNGEMEIIAPNGNVFGKQMQEKFRNGDITALRLQKVEKPLPCRDNFTKDGQPCVFPRGHRNEGIPACASQAEIDAQE